MLLPPPILRDTFVVRGTILAVGIIAAMMTFVGLNMQFGVEARSSILIGPFVILLLAVLLIRFSSSIRFLTTGIAWLSDRLTVFLFLLVPLFVILSVYVIFRNIT
jgi:hypothetical protein